MARGEYLLLPLLPSADQNLALRFEASLMISESCLLVSFNPWEFILLRISFVSSSNLLGLDLCSCICFLHETSHTYQSDLDESGLILLDVSLELLHKIILDGLQNLSVQSSSFCWFFSK